MHTGSQTDCIPGCGNFAYKTQKPSCRQYDENGEAVQFVDDSFCSSIPITIYDSFDETGDSTYHYFCAASETESKGSCTSGGSCGDGTLDYSEYCDSGRSASE